ncbi:hypothetical protein [Pseudoxanthomonas suwonensis]|uniref:Secreted protein n=1 Tax=Pseudoxanthomonas suwonensis TaxID=314722 RepID=A0A0E3Z1E3_9GAMM|nr:hypothetical protein [Pseudoxanthomonas suwonensis]AKC85599.1 hypothetical protein WQ53_01275 [Pseudoxanthomonas suwonensis]
MRRLLELTLLGMACCAWQPAMAQEGGQSGDRIRVVPVENVRIDYAQVLRVEPVYQTLRASRTEERCDPVPAEKQKPAEQRQEPGVFSRMVDSVKGMFSHEQDAPSPAPVAPATPENCRLVQVDRQFQRPIAYDVDYVYKGTKYRSRLAEDPGNRLRVRVAVTPWEAEAPPLPPP